MKILFFPYFLKSQFSEKQSFTVHTLFTSKVKSSDKERHQNIYIKANQCFYMLSGSAHLRSGPITTMESRGSNVLESWPYVSQALSKTTLFSETAISATPSFLDVFFLLIFYILQLRSLGPHQSISHMANFYYFLGKFIFF